MTSSMTKVARAGVDIQIANERKPGSKPMRSINRAAPIAMSRAGPA